MPNSVISKFHIFFSLQVSIRSSGCDEKESKPKVDGDGGGFALSRAWMFDGYYWVELQDMHEVSLNIYMIILVSHVIL